MFELLKDILNSVPVTGATKLILILIVVLAWQGNNKLDNIDALLFTVSTNYSALTQQVKDYHSNISSLQNQLNAMMLPYVGARPNKTREELP
jgi:cell division protein FtsB